MLHKKIKSPLTRDGVKKRASNKTNPNNLIKLSYYAPPPIKHVASVVKTTMLMIEFLKLNETLSHNKSLPQSLRNKEKVIGKIYKRYFRLRGWL